MSISSPKQIVFCIYIDTISQGPIPIERDEHGFPVVYAKREDAEREIAKDCIERLHQFLSGERTFDDALTVEEYVAEITRCEDGVIMDADGNVFPDEDW